MVGNADGRTASAELVEKSPGSVSAADDPTGDLPQSGTFTFIVCGTSKDKVIDITASLRIKPGESFELLKQKAIAEIKGYVESIPFYESTIFQSRVTVAILTYSGILGAGS